LKEPKTLSSLKAHISSLTAPRNQKFFGSFCQKRTSFLACLFLSTCINATSPCKVDPSAENDDRVCGGPQRILPRVTVQSGNIWPAQPALPPTLLDLQREHVIVSVAGPGTRSAQRRRLHAQLCGDHSTSALRALGLCYVAKRP